MDFFSFSFTRIFQVTAFWNLMLNSLGRTAWDKRMTLMPQGPGNAIQRDLFSFLFLPHVTSSILGQQYPKRPPCDIAAYAKSLAVLTQALGQRNLPLHLRLAATVWTPQSLWLSSSVLRVRYHLMVSAIPNWGKEISAGKQQQQNDPRNQWMCFRSLAVQRRWKKAMWRLL